MKFRVRKSGIWWFGETSENSVHWYVHTTPCFTKAGAKKALKRWYIEQNKDEIVEEFEIK